MRTSTLQELLPPIYEAALQGKLWSTVTREVAPRIRAHGTLVYSSMGSSICGKVTCVPAVQEQSGFASEMMESYLRYYIHRNVWAANEAKMTEGIAVTSSMLFPDRKLKRTEYYADWLKPQDIFYAIGGVFCADKLSNHKLTFVRSENQGPFDRVDVELIFQLMPHLKSAMRLANRIVHHVNEISTTAVDALPTAVLLVDQRGELLHANPAALTQMSRCRAFSACLGQPVFQDVGLNARMLSLLHLNTGMHPEFSLQSEAGLIQLTVTSLAGVPHRFGAEVVGVVTIMRPTPAAGVTQLDAPSQEFTQCHGFSTAEAEVFDFLRSGLSVKEISRARSCAVATTRTQVASLLGKAGARSQRELLARLGRSA